MTYRERRERKAARLREWAAKREAKSGAAFDRADRLARAIPMGQPILVGHHSERRHRRDLARIDNGMRAGVENQQKAQEFASRADEIERQAGHAIYRDDADAVERLRERIAELEAERGRMKAINREIDKGDGWEARIVPPLTDAERKELIRVAAYQPHLCKNGRPRFPSYALQNLGGNISRQRKRLERLEADAAGKTITARYAGECSACGGAIAPGDLIFWQRGTGARHVTCPGTCEQCDSPNVTTEGGATPAVSCDDCGHLTE
jgi:hypothetical protein